MRVQLYDTLDTHEKSLILIYQDIYQIQVGADRKCFFKKQKKTAPMF